MNLHDAWEALPQLTRDKLDHSARTSILEGLVRYPYWDKQACLELLAWALLENEIYAAHISWLSNLKSRAESEGREWTTEELVRQVRLTEGGDAA